MNANELEARVEPKRIFPANDITGLDLAFGRIENLLPPMSEIPEEFRKYHGNKWCDIAARWFYQGLKGATFKAKEGVDQGKALAHVQCVLGSWEPKHEHKMAGVGYLLSQFFDDITIPKV
jgi:hypothetical protein